MNYFVFTDEAGTYKYRPSAAHIRKHPFYIRANVIMSIDHYRQYQNDMERIYGECEVPRSEEVKWSDLWTREKHPRNQYIAGITERKLKKFYRKAFEAAIEKGSTQFLFTISDIVGGSCNLREEFIYKFHLQNAFQRVQMDMRTDDFATFIMDELNIETIKQIKAACHTFTVHGDFVDYKNIYQGVLIENSLYSPGIQLADFAAGVMNGYLRKKILSPNGFSFANDMYETFIKPRLRFHYTGEVVGYGIIDIPKTTAFRSQLNQIFDT